MYTEHFSTIVPLPSLGSTQATKTASHTVHLHPGLKKVVNPPLARPPKALPLKKLLLYLALGLFLAKSATLVFPHTRCNLLLHPDLQLDHRLTQLFTYCLRTVSKILEPQGNRTKGSYTELKWFHICLSWKCCLRSKDFISTFNIFANNYLK